MQPAARSLAVLAAAFAFLVSAALPAPLRAQPIEGIAAVVNDDVISTSDVRARLSLTLLGAGLEPSEENRQNLTPQVLRALIDETLQRQEIRRLDISVTDAEVEEAIAGLAQQNGMTADQFRGLLAANQVPLSVLEGQVATMLGWQRLVGRRLAPTVDIGPEEVDAVLARIEANRGTPEFLLAEILLTVDSPSDEASVRALAQELIDQVRGGARFSAVARQFSQSAGAATGGDLGWVLQGQMDPTLAAALDGMSIGQVTEPIRTASGYHILLLRDQRRVAMSDPGDATVHLYRIGLGFPPGMPESVRRQGVAIVQGVSDQVRGCDAFADKARELGVQSGLDGGTLRLRELPAQLRAAVEDLPVGQPTQPQRLPDGVMVLMVCERQAPPAAGAPSRDQIANGLLQERLDMLQRRYLRDLRNAAFIDVRV